MLPKLGSKTFVKSDFKPARRLSDRTKIDEVIKQNHNENLQYDADQAINWLENLFEENLRNRTYQRVKGAPEIQSRLGKILQDGSLLVRLFNLLADTIDPKLRISQFHNTPSSTHEIIINLNAVLLGVKNIAFRGTLFTATDILNDQNQGNVLGFIEQLMKRDARVWHKASHNEITLNIRNFKGPLIVKKDTKVQEIKDRMLEIQNIPKQEAPFYGVMLTRRNRPLPSTPAKSSKNNNNNNSDTFTASNPNLSTTEGDSSHPPSSLNSSNGSSPKPRSLTEGQTGRTESMEKSINEILRSFENIDMPPTDPYSGIIGNNEELWLEENTTIDLISEFMAEQGSELALQRIPKSINALVKVTQDNLKQMEDSSISLNPTNPPSLLEGDDIQVSFNSVIHLHSHDLVFGDLYISKFQLIFEPSNPANVGSTCKKRGFRIPLASVESIAKCSGLSSKHGKFYSFEIKAKDFHELKFSYLTKHKSKSVPISDTLQKYIFPSQQTLFAFARGGNKSKYTLTKCGYAIYDINKEIERLNISSSQWTVCSLNHDYQRIPSYPAQFLLPAALPESALAPILKFRSKSRIPALNWIHPKTGASLTRCSQPAVGLTGKTCKEDEMLFDLIRKTNNAPELFIVDARPKLNAVANQVKGLGYEKAYPNTRVVFLGIDNIHVMRKSLRKVRKICLAEPDPVSNGKALTTKVESSTKWFHHIKLLLNGALLIATSLEKGIPVCCHCSDGWDRTPQLTSLTQIILDPYARTIEGFISLIEKEWLAFGHKFDQRVGHTNANAKDSERAPIFIQFIDAVWQLHNQWSFAFEFNSYFLRLICMHLISCCFGTFLCNTEAERDNLSMGTSAPSLWELVLLNKNQFTNRQYSYISTPLCKRADFKFHLWEEYYLYWANYHL